MGLSRERSVPSLRKLSCGSSARFRDHVTAQGSVQDKLSLPFAKMPIRERTNIIAVISPKVVAKKSKYAVGDGPRNAFSTPHRQLKQ
jgi:hypothetical protein